MYRVVWNVPMFRRSKVLKRRLTSSLSFASTDPIIRTSNAHSRAAGLSWWPRITSTLMDER